MNQQITKKLSRLELIVAAYMSTAVLVLTCGLLFSLYLLNSATDQIDSDRGQVILSLENTESLLTNNIPLMGALDKLALASHLLHNDLNLISLNPALPTTPFAEHTGNLEQIAAELERLLPITLASRTTLIDATLTLADIADEAATVIAINNLQQLYRDSKDPLAEANEHIRQTKRQLTQQHQQLLSAVAENNRDVQAQLVARGDLFRQPISILGVLSFLILVMPLLILGLLFRHINRRIELLEHYANDIAREAFHAPPFDSMDKTGSLARTLGSLSVRVGELLHTTRIQAEDADYLANHDALTDLPNRRSFVDTLTRCIPLQDVDGTPCFLLFLDLDEFKNINDTLGHNVGDELIRLIGDRLLHALHSTDHIARLGGDEFAVMISCRELDLAKIADRVLNQVAKPMEVRGFTLDITASMGITRVYRDSTYEVLFKQADIAMYYAKQNGRNNFQLFHPHLEENINQRLALIDDLRTALEEQQFELHLQPKIDIINGAIDGVEALLRWHHPTKGMVSPAVFIPVAEECGLIIPIGEWVLREACRIAEGFYLQGLRLTVALNCSGRQLADEDFVDRFIGIISAGEFPPEMLEIEITETSLMEKLEASSKKLALLRHYGVRIAIDDFGTGYSSLRYLKDLPVTTIKIDRSFVVSAEKSSHDAAIIHAIAALGGNLHLDIIAEGVETTAQLKMIHGLGIPYVQGYIFAKPMPLAEFQQLLDNTPGSTESWRADTLLADACSGTG